MDESQEKCQNLCLKGFCLYRPSRDGSKNSMDNSIVIVTSVGRLCNALPYYMAVV